MKKDLKEIKKVKLTDITPYWRNPRNNFEAIEKVKASIEKFWYKNPILVDWNMVIVAWHTRYEALKQLWYKEVYIIVDEDMTEDEAKEYRLIDNKSGEFATRDEDKLNLELRDLLWDVDFMKQFYWEDLEKMLDETFWAANEKLDDIDLWDTSQSAADVEQEFEEQFNWKVEKRESEKMATEIICPKCFHKFYYAK